MLSSQIEGTQAKLTDVLRFETEAQAGQPINDTREVSNYVDAIMYGLERLEKFPFSLRLIRETHARLMQSVVGEPKILVSSGDRRTGSEALGQATPCSCPLHRTGSTPA